VKQLIMPQPLHLFDGYGIELEYMIVESNSLDVCPVADELLKTAAGSRAFVADVERGEMAWSNELVLHVVELKTNGPARELGGLAERFHGEVRHANALLADHRARLMPTAMHPWMDPEHEMRLWPHDNSEIYRAFNRIFDCRGHGWANLQSMHINLPFQGDQEFARLHAAIRLVLPLLPALAASSPLREGQLTGKLDTRLDVYRNNARRIPSVAGRVIPERCFSEAAYGETIFGPMFAEIAPHDPGGVLQDEFLNSRGAIARFSRGAIEIRLLDVQECPAADLAVAALVCRVVQRLSEQTWSDLAAQQALEIEPLEKVLLGCIEQAERAVVDDRDLCRCLGWERAEARPTAGQIWQELFEQECASDPDFEQQFGGPLRTIFARGPLARRIIAAIDGDTRAASLRSVFGGLCDCLAENRMLTA
jgi:glutamate---cysteine ligase / carboxylate-amine ligase